MKTADSKQELLSIVLAFLFHFTACSNPQLPYEKIDIPELHKMISLSYSLGNVIVSTSYVFIKIFELMDICVREEHGKLKINCLVDVRHGASFLIEGTCEKKEGKALYLRLENCDIDFSGNNLFMKMEGTTELSRFKVLYDHVKLRFVGENTGTRYVEIEKALSEIVLIESAFVRNFRVRDISGKIETTYIYISEYMIKDDGISPIKLSFENTTMRAHGCARMHVRASTVGYISPLTNSCPQEGTLIVDDKRVEFQEGKTFYEGNTYDCEIQECPIVSF